MRRNSEIIGFFISPVSLGLWVSGGQAAPLRSAADRQTGDFAACPLLPFSQIAAHSMDIVTEFRSVLVAVLADCPQERISHKSMPLSCSGEHIFGHL
jgi:hypothetical protein